MNADRTVNIEGAPNRISSVMAICRCVRADRHIVKTVNH